MSSTIASLPGHRPAGVHLRELTSTPLDLVVPRDHALARRSEVAIAELAEESFVDFPPGYGNRVVTDRAFGEAGLRRHVTIEITGITAGTDFVRQGLGVALLPRAGLRPDDDLVTLPVTGADLDWTVSPATPAGRTSGAAARALVEHRTRVLTFESPAAGLNGSCLLAPGVLLLADCSAALIRRVDLTGDGLAGTAWVYGHVACATTGGGHTGPNPAAQGRRNRRPRSGRCTKPRSAPAAGRSVVRRRMSGWSFWPGW